VQKGAILTVCTVV